MGGMRYSLIAMVSIGGQLTSLGLAFAFHFLMARLLGVALYGDFGVLVATFTILLFPITSVQAVLMREVARLHSQNKHENITWLITHYFKQGLLFGLLLAVIALVILFALGILLHTVETLLILLSIPLFYAVYIFNSYFQGKQQPFHYAGLLVLIDFFRLVFAFLLVSAGLSLLGIGFTYVIDALVLFIPILVFFYIKRSSFAKPFSFSLGSHLRWVFPTYALISLFLVVDLFFVRHLLTAESAGYYNAALTLARGIFYAAVGLMYAFLPQSSKLQLKKELSKILHSLLISIGLLLAFAVAVFLLKDVLLGILYGSAYLEASPLLGILTFSMFFLSLGLLFTNLMWSQQEQRIPLLVAGISAIFGLILFYFLTISMGTMGTAYASLAATFLLALLSGSAAWMVSRRSRKAK